jgi:tetratricopeptide (TPR) repeat protein
MEKKFMKLNYIKILLTGILFTFLASTSIAQRSNGLTVQGTLTVEEGSVEGAFIQMYRDGRRLDNYGIGSNGRYKVELNYNHEFTLIFARENNFSQKIVVNTNVPRSVLQSDPLFPPFTVDINLFTEIPGIDKTFSENTVLKIYYSTDVDNFISDVYYNNAQIKHLIDQAILQSQMIDKEADYLTTLTKAERAELQKEYDQLLKQAEEEYNNEQFLNALDGYQAASRIFPKEQYPKDRIAEINDLLGLMMVAGEMQKALAERLQSLLKQGDLQFDREQFEEAKNSYQRALSINSENEQAKNRIQEINQILEQRNIDQHYEKLITQADNAFDELLYKEAKSGYEQAIALKQNEAYPKDRLDEVNAILSSQAENAAQLQSYKDAIFQAEVNFEKQFYEEAISFYEKALTFKPGDEKATSKIKEINDLMYELANRTLYEKLIKTADRAFKREQFEEALADYQQAADLFPEEEWPNEQIAKINEALETQRTFARLISQADVAFDEERYGNSKNFYQQALEIIPEDEHATERIAQIDEILAQQNLEEQYSGLIAEADNYYDSEDLEQAKTKYREALSVKPGEKYPEDRINEIDAIFEERARLEERYRDAVAVADRLFQGEELEQARDAYENAAGIKPSETYPPQMIQRIDSLIAERERLLAEQKAAEVAAEQARLEAEAIAKDQQYQQIVDEADRLVDENELVAAVGKFREALDVKPEEQYPIVRIEEIRGMITRQQEAQEAYENAIAQADRDFQREEFDAARANYNGAKQAKPEETYPDEMLAKIDSIVDARARLAAEAEAAEQARLAAIKAEKDRNYNSAVSRGDSLFNLEEYETSRTAYREALQVKPEEAYPQQRIDEIGIVLAQLSAAQEAYEKAITQADRDFQREEFDAARANYNEAKQAKPEETYPDEMIAQIDSIVDARVRLAAEAEAAEQARLAAIQAEKDRNYNNAVSRGDSLFNLEEYETSRIAYREALQVKPEEAYPQQRIDEIGTLLAQLSAAQEAYEKAITQADRDFQREEFDAARANYNEAKQAKPEETYPDEMLAKIDSIVDARARLAAEAEAAEQARLAAIQAEKDRNYNSAVSRGDSLFNLEEYETSRTAYREALQVKPEESYPQQRIDEIGIVLAQLSAAQEAYENAIAQADRDFRSEEFDAARGGYNEAKQAKPEETYPDEMLAKIDSIVDARARLAAEQARLAAIQAEKDRNYNNAVSRGDSLFNLEEYETSRTAYREALQVKPEEAYPQQRIDEIGTLLAQLSAAQEAYENAIAQADRDFRSEEFDAARANYNGAKQAKPEETYPDEMLAKIDSIVDARARLAAEAEAAGQARLAAIQAEKDRNYNNAVSRGDSLFNLEEYETSRTAYREALQEKPEEAYPQKKIDEIDQILSDMELARLKQEQLERDYQNAIRTADQQLENQQYTESRGSYSRASEIKPEENYPQEQIAAIDSILEQRKLDEQYRTIILAADGFFRTKSYDQARSKYEEAQEVKPDEKYPKDQIAKIDDILRQEQEQLLAEQQAAADLEHRRQQIASQQEEIEEMEMVSEADLNDLYQEYIQRADRFFDNETYNVSRAWYYRAWDVKPDETYPPERIAEINRIVDGLLLSQRDHDYQQFIDLADSTFRDNQLAVARGWYNRALSVKSDESYPRNQLREIQSRIEERMANQSGELFNEHVQKGDDAFENGNYNVARFWYKKALELRPNDDEVKNKIQQIHEELN